MGTCSVEYGKVIDNFPEGLMRPDNMPVSGVPPAMPGCQISRMAVLRGSRRQSSNGRPLDRINTMGLPKVCNSFNNSSCMEGRARVERGAFSPLYSLFSPRYTSSTSASAEEAGKSCPGLPFTKTVGRRSLIR